MPSDHILTLLIAERDKLSRAIEVLQGPTIRRGRPPGSNNGVGSASPAAPKKHGRTFTASQRKKQAARMKAYWAAKKKADAKKG
jgi:hypothetical protein